MIKMRLDNPYGSRVCDQGIDERKDFVDNDNMANDAAAGARISIGVSFEMT
jgi:hypothetical protein